MKTKILFFIAGFTTAHLLSNIPRPFIPWWNFKYRIKDLVTDHITDRPHDPWPEFKRQAERILAADQALTNQEPF